MRNTIFEYIKYGIENNEDIHIQVIKPLKNLTTNI